MEASTRRNLALVSRAAAVAALLQIAGGGLSRAAAEASCEGYVGPGETLVLSADLGPCDGDFEVLLVDSGTVDLGGHTVSCEDTNADGVLPYGIVLVGKKAQLRNGTITGCWHGVVLEDRGKHRVENVTAQASWYDGFVLRAPRNQLTGNAALGNADDGFQIESAGNTLAGNRAEGNGEDGIDVVDASRNKLIGNQVSANVDDGLDVGGDRNKVEANEVTLNTDTGIRVGGKRNRVLGNSSTGNGGADILAAEPCKANKFRDNTYDIAAPSCVQ